MELKLRSLFLNRYWIVERKGSGGFGVVYRATDTLLFNREVAIKLLDPTLSEPGGAGTSEFRAMARMEAEAQARLSHPGVVKLLAHGFDQQTEAPYLVTEFIPGATLCWPVANWGDSRTGWLQRCRPFLDHMDQLLDILVSVHGQDVIHGDLSPQNIVLQQTGGRAPFVRVLDFGLARVRRRYGLQLPGLGTRITYNPKYAAPEQRKQHPTALSDQYTVGLMLWQGMSGHIPFGRQKRTPEERFVLRCTTDLAPLESPVPAPLAAVVDRATRRHPEERHDGMIAMAEAFQQALGELGGDPPPQQYAVPARHTTRAQGVEEVLLQSGFHPPDLHKCTLVLPAGVAEGDAVLDAVVGLLEEQVRGAFCGVCGHPLELVPISAGLFRSEPPRRIDVERLEFAPLVLWIISARHPMEAEEQRLMELLLREGRALVLRLVEGAPEPLQTYSPQVQLSTDIDHPGWEQIRRALVRGTTWPWLSHVLTEQWFTRDEVSPVLMGILEDICQGRLDEAIETMEGFLIATRRKVPENPLLYLRLAMMRAARDRWLDRPRVVEVLEQVAQVLTDYAPVWRQLGITWRHLGHPPRSQQCLEIACGLSPQDWDARSSLGGALRGHSQWLAEQQQQQYRRAIACYEDARETSGGNAYPVLNAMRLNAIGDRKPAPIDNLELGEVEVSRLKQVVEVRGQQATAGTDLPWSLFDQLEALLYLGLHDEAEEVLRQGPRAHLTAERRDIFLSTLQGLLDANICLPGLLALRDQVRDLELD